VCFRILGPKAKRLADAFLLASTFSTNLANLDHIENELMARRADHSIG
jgi:hypothetical protein